MAEINVSSGETSPFGVSQLNKGINFALFSHNATSVTLCLLLPQSDNHIELVLDPSINKTEDIWHICVEDLPLRDVLYRYRVDGPREMNQGHRFNSKILLLDPYAKLVKGRSFFGDINQNYVQFYGTYDFESPPFNWGDEHPLPNIPEKDLVIYEMNVRAFTSDESSGIDPAIRGSYLGVIEKIPYLLDLAINAVELMPVFEFEELEFQKHHNPRDHMVNTWGYSPVNFFAPMSCYASGEGDPIKASKEFKEMVKALHSAGIEIILDVVYNHTNGSDYEYPYTISFPGIDNRVYYMLDSNNQPLNYSGCGNTINCNHPDVMKLILDSLRHWYGKIS